MAKRVNTPFLVGLTLAIVVLGGAAFVARRIAHRPNAARHVQAAQEALKAGDLEKAWTEYSIAAAVDRTNKQLQVDRGDVANMRAGQLGFPTLEAARACWSAALEIDPHYKPALDRLLNSYIEQSEQLPGSFQLSRLSDAAARVLREDPQDARAQTYARIATIEQWQRGAATQQLQSKDVQEAIDALTQMQKKDPANAEVLFTLVGAKLHQAFDARRASQSDRANKLVDEARALLASATQSQPANASVNYAASRGYRSILISGLETDKTQAEHDIASMDNCLHRAGDSAKPGEPRYVEIELDSVEWAEQHQDLPGAERTLRKLLADPQTADDLKVHLAMAKYLRSTGDPAKRQEGVVLLTRPAVDHHVPGVGGIIFKLLQEQLAEELTYLHIDQFVAATDRQEKASLLTKVDEEYSRIAATAPGDSVPLLRLRAAVEHIKGQRVQSLETLKRAVDLMDHMPVKPSFQTEMIFQLARAYREQNQNRAAEARFQQVLRVVPQFAPARTMLIELYASERNFADAQQQLNELAKYDPKSPDLLRLRLALAQMQDDSKDVKSLYQQLPEDSLSARQFKAERAFALADYPDAARLFEEVLKEKPEDLRSTILLANTYVKQQQTDKAKALADRAVAQNPNEPRLKILQKQLNGASSAEVSKLVQDLLTSNDPFVREMNAARTEASQGKYDDAQKRLASLRQQRPDDAGAWSLTFQIDLALRRFDQAAEDQKSLARIDADQAGGRVYAWQLAMARADYPEAVRIGRELVKLRSAFAQSWEMLGDALRSAGQFNEALTQYRVALDIQSTNAAAYRGAVACLDALGQSDQARDLAATGAKALPNDAQLHELVLSHDVLTHAADVIPERQKALDQNPDDPANYFNLANTIMMASQQASATDPAKSAKFLEDARGVLDRGVAKFPKDLRLNAGLAELLERNGQFDAGRKVLDQLAALPEYQGKVQMLLILGEYCARGAHPEDAERYFREALAKSPDDAGLEIRLAQHLVQERRFDAAMEVLSNKANSAKPRVVRMRIETLLSADRLDEAEQAANAALQQDPKSEDLTLLLANVHLDRQNFKQARQDIRNALAVDPKNDNALYMQAVTEINDPAGGDLSLAVDDLHKLATLHPHNVGYHLELCNAFLRRQDRDAAAQELEDSLRVDPLSVAVRSRLLDIYREDQKWTQFDRVVQQAEQDARLNVDPQWTRAHALSLATRHDFPGALAKIQQAIEADHGAHPQFLRDKLDILIQARAYPDVLQQTDAMLAAGTKQWWVYSARGQARAAMWDKAAAAGEFDHALAAADAAKDTDGARDALLKMVGAIGYDQALARLTPRIATENRWRLLAVELHGTHGDWAGALDLLAPLLSNGASLPPDQRVTLARLASQAYHMTGQYDKAREQYTQWLALAPNDRAALNNLAYLLAEDLKKPQEARQFSRQAFDEDRRNGVHDPGVADTHGWVLTLCGGSDAVQGLNLLYSIVQDNPDFLEARYHLGVAYLRANETKRAEQQLTTAMAQIQQKEQSHASVDTKLKEEITAALKQVHEQGGAKARADVN